MPLCSGPADVHKLMRTAPELIARLFAPVEDVLLAFTRTNAITLRRDLDGGFVYYVSETRSTVLESEGARFVALTLLDELRRPKLPDADIASLTILAHRNTPAALDG
jgi:hypothetical protein